MLYNADALAANEIPVSAAIYVDDMCVQRACSDETTGRIRGLRPWIINEYPHVGDPGRQPQPEGRPSATGAVDLRVQRQLPWVVRPRDGSPRARGGFISLAMFVNEQTG
jgi:hypothetical protein